MRRRVGSAVLALLFLFLPAGLQGQESSSGTRVDVDGQVVFVVRVGVGSFTPAERARAASERLTNILKSSTPNLQTTTKETDLGWLIMVGNQPVISVTEGDAQAEGLSMKALADRWTAAVQEGLLSASRERARQTLSRRILLTATIVLGALLVALMLRRGRSWCLLRLEARQRRIPRLRFRGLEFASPEAIFRESKRVLAIIYAAGLLVDVGTALLLVFGQFPMTRRYAGQVWLWIWSPLVTIGHGILGYLPKLFYILAIVVVARLVLYGLRLVFEQAHQGAISLEPWVHRDVARPTSQIIKGAVIVLALFFIAPLLPGTGSTAAEGISVMIGLMVSFGSTSTVGNAVAGVVLTYMRPFQLGDRIKLGDIVGDVVERTFLYTKILTIKNEEVIMPSLQALSGALVNYSARARKEGLILHTTVTIGYDAPWRKVHELLIRAADRTTHMLKEPRPYVLQTSLDDWYVSYQLNAYTDQPNKMAEIYADLHQNIQDSFNEGGIEIMSAHFYQLRDGNATTIPADYLRNHEPARFLVDARTREV